MDVGASSLLCPAESLERLWTQPVSTETRLLPVYDRITSIHEVRVSERGGCGERSDRARTSGEKNERLRLRTLYGCAEWTLTALEHAFQAEITQTIIIKRDFKLRTQTPMREREGKQKKTATSRTVSLEPAPKQPPQADITPLSSEKITVVVSVIVVVLVAVPTASAVPRLAAPRSVVI